MAGYLQTKAGQRVVFVANPAQAPSSKEVYYARPDNFIASKETWRESLVRYNERATNNALGLFAAYELYENAV